MSGLVIIGVVVVAYAAVARSLDRLSITAPLVLMLTGLLLGPGAADLLNEQVTAEPIKIVAELALAIILFTDASTISVRSAKSQASMASRLLFIGSLLTIALGTLLAHLVLPSLSWAACALIASILAPTDAALGLAVVTSPSVPAGVRDALNIESGLNDGLVTPFVGFFLALTLAQDTHGHWTRSIRELAIAVGVGVGVGWLLGVLGGAAKRRDLMTPSSSELFVLAAGLLSYTISLASHANGFVGVYVAGFAFAAGSRGLLRKDLGLVEDTGLFGSFAVWLVFGAFLLGPVLRQFGAGNWRVLLYAALSLTIIRMLPVALALIGSKLQRVSVAFMGFFGPRGLASVVFSILMIDALPKDSSTGTLVQVAAWTIALSVVIHGLSSGPLSARYGRAMAGIGADAPEMLTGIPAPPRRRSLNQSRWAEDG